jgi:LysM repeat protein
MSRSERRGEHRVRGRVVAGLGALGVLGSLLAAPAWAAGGNFPITEAQRGQATQVAQAGVPLSDLAPNAPESHTVQRGDTLWDISKLFLKSPWRWPQLWGMNMEQIRNPHLIYPGQVLVLVKADGRAMLKVAQDTPSAPGNTVKLSPRVRSELLANGAIASLPLHLIGPFLNEAVVFDTDELARAPRIVATQEGRVIVSRGETAYVRGDLGGARDFRLFREPRPMIDPETKQVLGYEATYVGTAEFVREGGLMPAADSKTGVVVPSTFVVSKHAARSRRRRPPVARAAQRPDGLRAARTQRTDQRPHPVGLRRSGAGRAEPDRRAEPRRPGRPRARPCAGPVARRPGCRRPHRRPAHRDAPAGRTPRPAVRLPRVRPCVLRPDPVGAGPGGRGRPLHPALTGPRPGLRR